MKRYPEHRFFYKTSKTIETRAGQSRTVRPGLVLLFLCAFLSALLCSGCKTTEDIEAQQAAKEQGIMDLTAGLYDNAIVAFDDALSYADGITDDEYDICLYKAAAQYAKGDLEGAIASYTSLINYDNRYEPAFLRGSVYAANNEIHRALSDYREAVNRAPSNYDLYIAIYQNLSALHYDEQANTYLSMALEIKGETGEHFLNRGRIYLLQGQLDAAESALLKARDQNLESAGAYLALVREARGDHEGAMDALNRYKESESRTSADDLLIAETEMQMGDDEAALEAYTLGLSRETVSDAMSLRRGAIVAYEHLGRFGEAYQWARDYVADYPQDVQMARELQFLTSTLAGTEFEWMLADDGALAPEDEAAAAGEAGADASGSEEDSQAGALGTED